MYLIFIGDVAWWRYQDEWPGGHSRFGVVSREAWVTISHRWACFASSNTAMICYWLVLGLRIGQTISINGGLVFDWCCTQWSELQLLVRVHPTVHTRHQVPHIQNIHFGERKPRLSCARNVIISSQFDYELTLMRTCLSHCDIRIMKLLELLSGCRAIAERLRLTESYILKYILSTKIAPLYDNST